MPLTINWDSEIINITSPTTSVDGQVLHDFIEDSMAAPEGLLYNAILKPEGKIEDPSNPGIYSQIIIILNSPWQIQFWGGSGYTRIYGAKIVGGLADEPFKATGTAGDITILESPVDGVTVVSGSGLSTPEHDQLMQIENPPSQVLNEYKANVSSLPTSSEITDAVWEDDLSVRTTTDSAGKTLWEVVKNTVNRIVPFIFAK